MRIHEQAFSAKVELPCRIFCGPDSMLEFPGTAVNIGPGTVRLQLGVLAGPWKPVIGEQIRLELLLPVKMKLAKAKCLSVRATVADVAEVSEGMRRVELRFRKPAFKDRPAAKDAAEEGPDELAKAAKAAQAKWEM
jgi:hypothetical protein